LEQIRADEHLYGGGMGDNPQALASFESGLHAAFLLSFAITLLAALVSAMRPSHRPLSDLGDSSQPPRQAMRWTTSLAIEIYPFSILKIQCLYQDRHPPGRCLCQRPSAP
jgi:hypothetical protein